MWYPDLRGSSFQIITVFTLLFVSACHASVNPRTEARHKAEVDSKTGIESDIDRLAGSDRSRIPALVAPVSPSSLLSTLEVSTDNATPVTEPAPVERELYTVIADRVPVKEILTSIARDASTQVSFVGDVAGYVSLSITNQPLEFILQQISLQAQVRVEMQGGRILLIEDKPYIRTYEIDYLNVQRIADSRVDLATQIGSIRTTLDEAGGAQAGNNGSQLTVENKTVNALWESVVHSISGILGEQVAADNSGSENVFVSQESGIVSVRARKAEHSAIQMLLEKITESAQRQVLIEATVVEVALNDRYESGVDWRVLAGDGNETFQFSQILAGLPEAATTPVTALFTYNNTDSILGNLSATLKLLQQFGEVQVLSRPTIIALNNQPAVLKVVDNRVYFTFEVERLERDNGDERTVVESTVHSVPIGLVMNVTPFITRDQEVILNIRPTISRILNFAEDPSPALAGQTEVRNLIPEIQIREMESLLRVQSGNVAIIGGLMQNKVDNRTAGVPGLQQLPVLGRLFTHEIRDIEKTELLVFLKPTVIDHNRDGINTDGL